MDQVSVSFVHASAFLGIWNHRVISLWRSDILTREAVYKNCIVGYMRLGWGLGAPGTPHTGLM